MQLPARVLLIEDDRQIAYALLHALSTTYPIDIAPSGKAGLYKADIENYAAIILDLNLPDLSGILVCQQLRERGVSAPILILTAESQVLTKINVLDAGANDYLTKPFSLGELKARLRVLTRYENKPSDLPAEITLGNLVLNRQTRQVSRSGEQIDVRRKEYAILECLMLNAGVVVSRQALLNYAWQGPDEPWANTLDVHIKHLRDKIDRPFDEPLILTVHGVGYRLAVPKPIKPGKR